MTQQVGRFCQFEITGSVCVKGENFGPRIEEKNNREDLSAFEM